MAFNPKSLDNLKPGMPNKGGMGRPRNYIRRKMREPLPAMLKRLEKMAEETSDPLILVKISDHMAKYGLGTQVETTVVSLSRDLADFAQMLISEYVPLELRDAMLEKLAVFMEDSERSVVGDEDGEDAE